MKKLFTLVSVLVILISISGLAQKTWTGATSTNWGTASNWSPNGVPAATDYVTIPSAPLNQPVLSGAGTCSTLNIAAGASLSISATSANTATMTVTLNSLINGSLSIGGSITKASKLITKNINWLSGSSITPYINSSMEVSGNWYFSSGSSVNMGFCSVQLTGVDNATVFCNSNSSNFQVLTLNKASSATVTIDPASTSNLLITSTITINSGNSLISAAPIASIFKGNIMSSGSISFSAGNQFFERTSGIQLIQLSSADYFSEVSINTGGTVQLTTGSNLTVKGDFAILGGLFDPNNNTVTVGGNWVNNTGEPGFLEGAGRVIFNGGNFHQYCSDETFNILEINKPLGGEFRINGYSVTCSSYDWTAGAINVQTDGSFTALDLADDGLWGKYIVNPGSTMDLHQDASQRVDLGGDLVFTNGGTINVYGGSMQSHWPLVNNGSISMNAGTLDFKDQGILVYALGGVSLTTNITGGTIRTPKFFFSGRSDFNPSGGTVELYGEVDDNLQMTAGSLYNLMINKGNANTITVLDDLQLNGELQVTNGTMKASGIAINTLGNITIEADGVLWIENGTQLKIGGTKILTVNSAGTLKSIGTSGSPNLITHLNSLASHFEFQVHGTLSARYTTFEYNHGVNIWNDATIDPANPLDYCTFQNGVDRLMIINNNQDIMIRNVNFPTNALYNNVWKSIDAGRVNFRDATGIYAGATFEQDPFNRLDWTSSQPGLWTGAVSTDWHTAGNWDDLNVPSSATNVTIPSGLTNMPVVGSATANCNNLNINGMLTIQDHEMNVGGNVKVNGSLAMNHYLAMLEVQGSVQWYSGSSANISANANILVHGNWTFSAGSNAILANGSVMFKGTESKSIFSHSATSSFNDLYVEKTTGTMTWSSLSTEALRTKGFYVSMNNSFISDAAENLIVSGNFYSFGSMAFNSGSVVFNGTDQLIIPNENDYLNNLIFNQTGTITINQTNSNTLTLRGDLTLNSGVFNPGNSILKIGGSWLNNSGPDAFVEGTSRVVFEGAIPQFCNTEQFNILEINKSSSVLYFSSDFVISCQSYDWTNGGFWVAGNAGFYAYDLADPGIAGLMFLYDGIIELHQDQIQRIDLLGDVTIAGGEFKVYGGSDQSQWGQNANASLTMSGGTLDFVDKAIAIQDYAPYTFTSTVTGGIIRTQNGFLAQSAGFNPIGGTVFIYGENNCMILSENGSAFYNLVINKPNGWTSATLLTILVKNNLTIEEGLASILFGFEIECWNNLEVQAGGWLSLESSTVKMKNLASINVYQNGSIRTSGFDAAFSKICGISPTDYYSFTLHSGSSFEASYTIFENPDEQGIYFAPGSSAGQANTFKNCIFRNGKNGPYSLITIDNEQDLVIENATFPTNTWGGLFNVRKAVDAGNVTFVNSNGEFSGEVFDDDPYNRIHWISQRQLTLSSVFIQGLYDGNGVMHQAQDENGAHWSEEVADIIWVELHDALNYDIIAYTAAYVQLSTIGSAMISIPAIHSGSFYVTIRHRNGIETTTSVPLVFSGPSISYSFDSPEKAYGGNLFQASDGGYVIYSGDTDQDGLVDSSDMISADNDVSTFETGYIVTDINGDGLVDSSDMIIIDNNSGNFIGTVLP